jgi:hypothetical protein
MSIANGFGRTHGHDRPFALSSLPHRRSSQSSRGGVQVSLGVGACPRCMGNQVSKVIQGVTVTLASKIKRLHDGILLGMQGKRTTAFYRTGATVMLRGAGSIEEALRL